MEKINQSCVVGGLAVGSTVNTSFQFFNVSGCWRKEAALAAALFFAASTGDDGTAGMAEDTAAVAWLKKPLILSSNGTCCSATASAGRARTRLEEKRILGMCCEWKMLDYESRCTLWGTSA